MDFAVRRSELLSRVSLCKGSDLVSHHYLSSLLHLLDNFGKSVDLLWEGVVDMMQRYADNFERIRTELSLVPVDFVYKKKDYYNPYASYASGKHSHSYGLERKGRRFTVGTKSCPASVLPMPESELAENMVVWCLYPVDLARSSQLRLVCVWSVEDSLVDWLYTWIQADKNAASVVQSNGVQDVLWTFSVISPPVTPCLSSKVHLQNRSPKDRILAYICEQSPVSTSEIMAQSFTGRSRVYEILHELQIEGKIIKVGQGRYETVYE